MDIIRQYAPDTPEYLKLKLAATALTHLSTKGITYRVEDTWFDYGQRWMWTTILAHDPDSNWGDYQALCPRDFEKILLMPDILNTVNEIRSDKWWRDK